MATQGNTLSTVLLVIAMGSTGSAALGALALGGMEILRRWREARARKESPTYRFRMPQIVAPPPDSLAEVVLDGADVTSPTPLVDPTDRFKHQPLFEAQPANDDLDPFEGDDTTPLLDFEPPGRLVGNAEI